MGSLTMLGLLLGLVTITLAYLRQPRVRVELGDIRMTPIASA
jgi:hypothetical protein